MKKSFCNVVFIFLLQSVFPSEAVLCYRCVFAPYVYLLNNTFLCEDFDYSEKFVVNCPYSTVCLKKIIYANINGIQVNGTERDCASQKLDTQFLSNGKWHPETRVEEPYSEGCKMEKDKGVRTPAVEHCYCRGKLCNSGNSFANSKHFYLFYILLNFLICR